MREVVSLHLGQAGRQVGTAFWETLAAEHHIGLDGKPTGENDPSPSRHFTETEHGVYVPKAVFADMDPDGKRINRAGTNLFNESWAVAGTEEATICSRGYLVEGKLLAWDAIEHTRRAIETCDNPEAISITHSVNAGTGSGTAGRLLEILQAEYPKKLRVAHTLLPSPRFSNSTVEPYNVIWSTSALLEHADLVCMYDNEAVYKTLESGCSLADVNREVAGSVLGLATAGIGEIVTNLVPYPRIHFAMPYYGRCGTMREAAVEALRGKSFQVSVPCAPQRRYISGCLLYHDEASAHGVAAAIADIRSEKSFRLVDWVPTGIKIAAAKAASTQPPPLTGLFNSMATGDIFATVSKKFDYLYSKRAFIHWFDGMMEGEFSEARENVAALEKDHEEHWGCCCDWEAEEDFEEY